MNMQTLFQEYRKSPSKKDKRTNTIINNSIVIIFIFILCFGVFLGHKIIPDSITIEKEHEKRQNEIRKMPGYNEIELIYAQSFGQRELTEEKIESNLILKEQASEIYKAQLKASLDSISASLSIPLSFMSITFLCIFLMFLTSRFFSKFLNSNSNILMEIKRQKHNGSIYEIFDKDCESTSIVLKEYAQALEDELLDKQYISGATLIEIDKAIENEKMKKSENTALKERKDALINSNTQSGIMLREIESLKNNN